MNHNYTHGFTLTELEKAQINVAGLSHQVVVQYGTTTSAPSTGMTFFFRSEKKNEDVHRLRLVTFLDTLRATVDWSSLFVRCSSAQLHVSH